MNEKGLSMWKLAAGKMLGQLGSALGVMLTLSACAAPRAVDDGFSAKLATGCSSQVECDALFDAAEQRFQNCMKAADQAEQCGRALEDKSHASNIRRSQMEKGTASRRESSIAVRAQANEEIARYRDDQRRLGSSCEDLAVLEKAGTSAQNAQVGEKYVALVSERRTARVRELLSAVHDAMEQKPVLADLEKPSEIRKDIEKAKTDAQGLRCYDPAAASQAQADVGAWAEATERDIAAEETCRATPKCMGARLAVPLCTAINERRIASTELASERRNPSGVVDLVVLHDLGRHLQDTDAELSEMRAQYRALTHKPFNESSCQKR